MSTIAGRDQTALIVIDVQNDVVAGAYNLDRVVATINAAVDKARQAGIPVIWVQHNDDEIQVGTPGWQYVPQLQPRADEPIVAKSYRSSFEATNLEELLAESNVGRLILCGAQSNYCIRNTVHAALEAGYDIELIADAHTTTDYANAGVDIDAKVIVQELNDNLYDYQVPGRSVKARPLAGIDFAG